MEANWQSGFEQKMVTDAVFRQYIQDKYLSQEAEKASSPSEGKDIAESGEGE
jgi:hypothetical protein